MITKTVQVRREPFEMLTVTGVCSGLEYDDQDELYRIFIKGMDQAFYTTDGWTVRVL
jgi:hypothetical protein